MTWRPVPTGLVAVPYSTGGNDYGPGPSERMKAARERYAYPPGHMECGTPGCTRPAGHNIPRVQHSIPRVFVGTYPCGAQVLVTLFADGTAEAAFRDGTFERWSPPVDLVEEV